MQFTLLLDEDCDFMDENTEHLEPLPCWIQEQICPVLGETHRI